ncbi:nicotinic acid mononucleotide adenyltransferase [Psychroserpens sp. NJDZ02]|uniref:nicotinic acid mononucleotide adenyltransferase n=1 Tax=Psychroserpens sp. NJDZ02 TaxID=2570561 RepID=UPI0010A84515|nr:nicotinic acid mononucleotide adenyltransferase [Psychroserpens sp. NJDZ02]QCE41363.1 nicotinic acid mononucleotide adenyltransferase [Psychroserpens sp. NJDZ02]
MKTIKLLTGFALIATLFTSCYTEVVVDDYNGYNDPIPININQVLNSNELWYVAVEETIGYGESPFLQIAFTVSFRNGTLYANNNLVGIGSQGNGYGIAIGYYNAYDNILDVDHDIDGNDSFDVYQIDNNTIELYNPFTDTSYFLHGYQRSNFDYDFVFYDNIQYFLQEYEGWEKTYTSNFGALNEFDNENYLQFLSGGNDDTFRSSQDANGINPNNLYWDYTGLYGVGNVIGNMYLKTLVLDYDYFDNEQFELSILNDQRIELYHPSSGTVYEFTGRGYIEYLRVGTETNRSKASGLKKRVQHTEKKDNARDSSRT